MTCPMLADCANVAVQPGPGDHPKACKVQWSAARACPPQAGEHDAWRVFLLASCLSCTRVQNPYYCPLELAEGRTPSGADGIISSFPLRSSCVWQLLLNIYMPELARLEMDQDHHCRVIGFTGDTRRKAVC